MTDEEKIEVIQHSIDSEYRKKPAEPRTFWVRVHSKQMTTHKPENASENLWIAVVEVME